MCESNHLTRGNLRRERDRGRVRDESLSSKYKLLRCLTTHFEFRITTIRAVPLATTHIRIRAHSSGLLVFNTFFQNLLLWIHALDADIGRAEWNGSKLAYRYVCIGKEKSFHLTTYSQSVHIQHAAVHLFIYACAWECACSIAQWNKSKSSVLYKNKFHLHQLETMLSRSGY